MIALFRALALFLGVALLLVGAPWWLRNAICFVRGWAVVPGHVLASGVTVGAGCALLGVVVWVG